MNAFPLASEGGSLVASSAVTGAPAGARFPVPGVQEVVLKFFAPEARTVKVAGNFNGWHPEATPMECSEAGEWMVRLLLPPGQYEYRFIADGHWQQDPHAGQQNIGPFGDIYSVLTVPANGGTNPL